MVLWVVFRILFFSSGTELHLNFIPKKKGVVQIGRQLPGIPLFLSLLNVKKLINPLTVVCSFLFFFLPPLRHFPINIEKNTLYGTLVNGQIWYSTLCGTSAVKGLARISEGLMVPHGHYFLIIQYLVKQLIILTSKRGALPGYSSD